MSYDLNIFAADLPPNPIPDWIKRLNTCDHMTYEINPAVAFDVGLSGFCPMKVTVPGRWPWTPDKAYMSGFEMSVQAFDFASYFDLNSHDADVKKNQLTAEGFDFNLWETFKFQVLISFKPCNKFEAELAFLSAAILTQDLNGICNDPQTRQDVRRDEVFDRATKQIEQQQTATKTEKPIPHPFEGWR